MPAAVQATVQANLPVPMAVVTTAPVAISRGRLTYVCPANQVVGIVNVPPSTSWLPPDGHTIMPAGTLTVGSTVP